MEVSTLLFRQSHVIPITPAVVFLLIDVKNIMMPAYNNLSGWWFEPL